MHALYCVNKRSLNYCSVFSHLRREQQTSLTQTTEKNAKYALTANRIITVTVRNCMKPSTRQARLDVLARICAYLQSRVRRRRRHIKKVTQKYKGKKLFLLPAIVGYMDR